MNAPEDSSRHELMRQMLEWIAARPRTYAQAMDAWRSSCPRHPVWDDAMLAGYICVSANSGEAKQAAVCLTDRGRAYLNNGLASGAGPAAPPG